MGVSLTTGDFNGDSKIDLVIGAPAEGSGTFLRTGAITIIPGTAGLLTVEKQNYSSRRNTIKPRHQSCGPLGRCLRKCRC